MDHKNIGRRFPVYGVSATALGLALVALAAPAMAQEQQAETVELADIVVTAQKRAANLQDVPFSIAAATEDMIRSTGSASIVDLSRNVAGLAIADLGPGQSQVAIRGVSSGQVVRDESSRKETVGFYLDESVISLALFTPDLDLFDLNRVEVLRGPQGTLFGSGNLSGTVRYITNQPNLTEFQGAAEGNVSMVEKGGVGLSTKGAVNIPLVADKLAVRAVGYYNRMPGFIDAIAPGGQLWRNVNDGTKYGGRLALTFKPTETLTITPRVVYQKLDTDGYPRADVYNLFHNPHTTTRPAGTFDGLQQFIQLEEGLTDDFLLVDNTMSWDVGPVTFTSVTSYIDREVDVMRDSGQLTGQITAMVFGQPQLATLDAPLLDQTGVKQFSQEFRVSSNTDGPLQWVVGGYYTTYDKKFGQRLHVPGFEAGFNAATGGNLNTAALSAPVVNEKDHLFVSDFDIDHRQYALFGEASYEVTDRLTTTLGLRWYDFKEERHAIIAGLLNDGPTPAPLRQRTTSDSGINPRFIVAYEVSDTVTLNMQAAKGFRLGGINDPLITNICRDDIARLGGADIERFKDETLWNYEAGFKARSADGRLTFNAAAYYIDMRDVQVSVRLPCSSTITLNVPKARSMGLEAEFSARPTDWVDFGVSVAYSDAEVRESVDLVDIRKGDRLPTSPKWQISTNVGLTKPLNNDMDGFVNFTMQYLSSSYSFLLDQRNNGTLPFDIRYGRPAGNPFHVDYPTKLDGYAIGNVRFGVRAADSWEIALYINNVWDERAQLALDRERGGEGRVAYIVNQPRTYGINARFNF